MRKKLFAEFTDDQVKKMVTLWRDYAKKLRSQWSYTPYSKGEWVVHKNIYSKEYIHPLYLAIKNRLDREPYKNYRLELKFWRDLYIDYLPTLRVISRMSCDDGKRWLKEVQVLYHNKKVNYCLTKVVTTTIKENIKGYIWETMEDLSEKLSESSSNNTSVDYYLDVV